MTIERHMTTEQSVRSIVPARTAKASMSKVVCVEIDGREHFFTFAAARALNESLVLAMLDDSSPHRVIAAVCIAFDVSINELIAGGRPQRIVEARIGACYLLRNVLKLSARHCGELMRKDHSSINWSVRKCQDWMDTDAKYRARMEPLIAQFS